MGTYGYAQFQIDVRKTDEDLQRAVDEFKARETVDKHGATTLMAAKTSAESGKESEEE